MSKTALNKFGKLLIESVRDRTIRYWNNILSGHMKGDIANKVRMQLKDKTGNELYEIIIAQVIDSVLHNTLDMVSQQEELSVTIHNQVGKEYDLREISDGLAGELYSDSGWIKKYSKYTK